MSRHNPTPSYRLHKQSGQAIVTLPDGQGGRRDVLLGKFDTAESRAQYDRVIAEWLAAGRRVPPLLTSVSRSDLTINELCLAYWRHVEGYYVKDGKPTSEQDTIRQMLRFVRRLYGDEVAKEFGPLKLKAVREAMVAHNVVRKYKVIDPVSGKVTWQERTLRKGLARRFINKQIGRVKRMFGWAVGEELIPAETHAALERVEGLRKGRGQAREKPRIKPALADHVNAVRPLLPPTVLAMVEAQLLSGCRPQDIVKLRGVEIDRTRPVWENRPPRYKTEHHNDDDSLDRERVVHFGSSPRRTALITTALFRRRCRPNRLPWQQVSVVGPCNALPWSSVMSRLVPMARCQAVVLSSLLAVVLLGAAQIQTDKGKKHALVVGVRDYRSSKFEPLRFTENDAEELAEVLQKQAGFSVRVLTTSRGARQKVHAPTAANVRAALAALLARKARGARQGGSRADFPVDNVSWSQAVEFCRKLTRREMGQGRVYRLPSEAEWEHACRGGPSSSYQVFHFGSSLSSAQATFNGNFPSGDAGKGESSALLVQPGGCRTRVRGSAADVRNNPVVEVQRG